ncbi:Uncharacterised protein [Mycobacteroides abscessus subsp. abscessus]|nr:Uncharacterised protein [Mycobacteroides abscessus subsp. abscessus]
MNVGLSQSFWSPHELAATRVGAEETAVFAVIVLRLCIPPGAARGIARRRIDTAEQSRRVGSLVVADHLTEFRDGGAIGVQAGAAIDRPGVMRPNPNRRDTHRRRHLFDCRRPSVGSR